jgi:acetyl-CoA carboxylase biotin carboxyl carrier protein
MSGEAKERASEAAPGSRVDRSQIVDLDFLRGLIAAVDDSGIDSLEISRGGTRIRIAKTPAPMASVSTGTNHSYPVAQQAPPASPATAPSQPAAEVEPAVQKPKLVEVTSPMVGTFYRSPAPEAPSYVEIGSRVVKGQTLCILEAMKLMNELESEVQGVVREICADNSEPVEYGQVLFRLEPEA